jgi:hypothetical protein
MGCVAILSVSSRRGSLWPRLAAWVLIGRGGAFLKVTIGEKSFGGLWQVLWRACVGASRVLGGFWVITSKSRNVEIPQSRSVGLELKIVGIGDIARFLAGAIVGLISIFAFLLRVRAFGRILDANAGMGGAACRYSKCATCVHSRRNDGVPRLHLRGIRPLYPVEPVFDTDGGHDDFIV